MKDNTSTDLHKAIAVNDNLFHHDIYDLKIGVFKIGIVCYVNDCLMFFLHDVIFFVKIFHH